MKKSTNKQKKYILSATFITLLTLVLGVILNITPIANNLNNIVYDQMFRSYSKFKQADTSDVAIIEINDASLAQAQERGIFWPWSRNVYSVVSDFLVKQGAKAVVFDILFTSPDIDRADSYGDENDEAFHDVMVDSDKVLLAFSLNKDVDGECRYLKTKTIDNAEKFNRIATYASIESPYQLFTEDNDNFGFADIQAEQDGVIRQYKPLVRIDENVFPSLAVASFLLANGSTLPETLNLTRKGNFNINWYGEGGYNLDKNGELTSKPTFNYYSFWYVFVNALKSMRGIELSQEEAAMFKDKVVFIGASARGLLDQKQTPFTVKGKAYPGVEIHATAYLNLVQQNWLKTINIWIELLILTIIIFMWSYWSVQAKSFLKNLLAMVGLFFIGWFVSVWLFINFNIKLDQIVIYSLLLISIIVTLIMNYYLIGHNQNKIKNAFKSYLSPDLLKEITDSHSGELSVGGTHTSASALFIDIAGFTTFSEKNDVDTVVRVLNIYLKEFSAIIMKNNGFVNKFLGDGLMALFGAPSNYPNHAEMAVKSAFECYQKNKELSKMYELNVRIGVNSGEMICGNMGGSQRLEYTAIGDNVNLASRLEGTNKFFDTKIMVGENTYKMLGSDFEYKEKLMYIGKFSVKGKEHFIEFYCFDDKSEQIHKLFKQILASYEKNDLIMFKKLAKFFSSKKIVYGPADFYFNYYNANKTIGQSIKLNQK